MSELTERQKSALEKLRGVLNQIDSEVKLPGEKPLVQIVTEHARAQKKPEHSNDWYSWSETVDADSSLYLVHQAGADDIYPARSWREAVEIASDINTSVLEYVRRTENDGLIMSWATPYRRDIAIEQGVVRS